jgi:hypothetical protein
MDRMSFVPGADARKQMENCNGLIFFGRQGAVECANEYIFPSGQNILYQTVSAALSEGDEVDITFELKENEDMDLEDEGATKATFTDKTTGRKKVLWEVSNTSEGLGDAQIERAYNAYRNVLAAHLGVPPPPPLQDCEPATFAAGSRKYSHFPRPLSLQYPPSLWRVVVFRRAFWRLHVLPGISYRLHNPHPSHARL